MKNYFDKYGHLIVPTVFLVIISLPAVLHLESLPIRVYDEARQAVSAVEMAYSQNYIVTTFNGQPEMWSVKPPLLVWLQSLCIQLFGIGELAIRLPVAIFSVLTLILLFVSSKKLFEENWMPYLSAGILMSSMGFVSLHAARTGDYDVPVTFFMAASTVFMFLYLEGTKNVYLLLFFVFISLACLTKGVVGLMFLPGIIIYISWQRKLKELLTNSSFYWGVFIFMVLVFGYYLIREYYNSGYLLTVWEEELGGRFFTVKKNNDQEFFYYTDNLILTRYSFWLPFWIISFLYVGRNKYITYLNIIIFQYLLLISLAKTKHEWYDIPIYPLLAITSAYSISKLLSNFESKQIITTVRTAIMVGVLMLPMYLKNLIPVIENDEIEFTKIHHHFSYYLRKIKSKEAVNIYYSGYAPHLIFYQYMYKEKGVDINIYKKHTLHEGMVVLVRKGKDLKELSAIFDIKVNDSKYLNEKIAKIRIVKRRTS